MKNWDVIKMLAENHTLTFKNLRFGGIVGYLPNGALGWISNSNRNGEPFSIHCVMDNEQHKGNWNDDWEQLPQEVTWQEAIQAKLDGMEFRIEYRGNTYKQKSYSKIGYLESSDPKDNDGKLKGFYAEMFKNGKWYIES